MLRRLSAYHIGSGPMHFFRAGCVIKDICRIVKMFRVMRGSRDDLGPMSSLMLLLCCYLLCNPKHVKKEKFFITFVII